MRENNWEKIGTVGVDSGQLILVDPCYLDEFKKDEFKEVNKTDNSFSYSGCCNVTLTQDAGQIEGGAVVTSTGYGDGCYEVFVKKEEGRVKEMKVVFF